MDNEQLDIETFAPTAREQGLLDKFGRENPDPTPMAPPLGYKRQPSISERIREMVQNELFRQGQAGEVETFEEANDFEDDDGEPSSPYEFDEDAELELALASQAQKDAQASVPQTNKPASPEADNAAGAATTPKGKKPAPEPSVEAE